MVNAIPSHHFKHKKYKILYFLSDVVPVKEHYTIPNKQKHKFT